MTENEVYGGAGAALAAHSKDGSASGGTPAAQATGAKPEPSLSEKITRTTDQIQDGVDRAATVAHEAIGAAGDSLAKGGRAVEGAAHYVRDLPFAAMIVTGVVGLLLGALLTRR